MIKDRIDNATAYVGLGAGIARALEYLRTTDCTKLTPGKHAIDGQQVFAAVQKYSPKPVAQAAWESHHRYIDVQYVAVGRERMGYTSLVDGLPVDKPYDPQTDLIFYKTRGDLITFETGEFAIFSPQDVHAPGLAIDGADPVEVLKVVVKVRVNESNPPTGF